MQERDAFILCRSMVFLRDCMVSFQPVPGFQIVGTAQREMSSRPTPVSASLDRVF